MNVVACSGKAQHMTCVLINTPNNIPLALLSCLGSDQILVRHHNLQIMVLDKAQLRLVLPLLVLLATFANAQSSIKYVDIGKITPYMLLPITIPVCSFHESLGHWF